MNSSKTHLKNNLTEKYSGRIPRYTSYPTAVELKDISDTSRAVTAIQKIVQSQEPQSLYIHLPYCKELCYFCACNKIITQDHNQVSQYLKLLAKECHILTEVAGGNCLVSDAHLGGGTPSYLSVENFKELDQILSDNFSFTNDFSKSIELDPRTVDATKINGLADLGYKRGSLGVQDLDPQVQTITS
jgi:oxygen-independent coproporphyrinogen-3 oxidase